MLSRAGPEFPDLPVDEGWATACRTIEPRVGISASGCGGPGRRPAPRPGSDSGRLLVRAPAPAIPRPHPERVGRYLVRRLLVLMLLLSSGAVAAAPLDQAGRTEILTNAARLIETRYVDPANGARIAAALLNARGNWEDVKIGRASRRESVCASVGIEA